MPTPPLTDKRRNQIKALFLQFDRGNPHAKEDNSRIAAAMLEPLVKIKEGELRYMRRMHHALTTDNTIGAIAAVMALQRDTFAAAHPGQPVPRGFNLDGTSSMLLRSANIASRNAVIKYLNEDDSMGFRRLQRGREIEEFLSEELAKLDVEVEAAMKLAEDAPNEPREENEPAAPGL